VSEICTRPGKLVKSESATQTIGATDGDGRDRNRPFERIAELVQQYEEAGNPWFSMDTRSKEHLGFLYRKGQRKTTNNV
jgi:hypothetical protein